MASQLNFPLMWAVGQLQRSRRLISLFAVMVLLPAVTFGVLIVRAVRNEGIQAAQQKAERQRHIVRLIEADLNNWLFSAQAGSAVSQALFRFRRERGRVVFPAYRLSLPLDGAAPRPFMSSPPAGPLTREVITEFYYPRIVIFLRDFHGAQYFLRLKTLVVSLPERDEGYVLEAQPIVEHVNRRLNEFCAGTGFAGSLWLGDLRDTTSAPATGVYALEGFSFFQIVFHDVGGGGPIDFGGHLFGYSMAVLVLLTIFASVLVYRAVSQEAQLSKLRADFVSAVSHEFRSPLSSILALSERLESSRVRDADQLAQYHHVIGDEARRLSTLVARLLDFAQIEDGKKVYALDRVDLAATAREAVLSCRRSGSPDRFRFQADDASPLWVRADRTAISHCIQNLVENAVKYSPAESPIDVRCASLNGAHVVEIRDRGIGISRADQLRIFEKFYRAPQAAGLDAQGVGIGLALVKHVMEAHGGSVTVESEPGRGSRFTLSLPRADGVDM
jgi:nitrogen-specific signal transduction histidine kinase